MAEPEDPPNAPGDLEAVFAEVRPTLLRLAERLCGNLTDAEDVVQETFLRAVHGLPHDVRNVAAWLTTTLRNVGLDHLRKRKRRPSHEPITDHDALTQLEPDVPEPDWDNLTIDDIRDAVEVLEPAYRDVYRLHTFEGLSYKQVAERLGIQRVTVGTRLNRARGKLREVLFARFGLGSKP
ncbi:MAG TPA: RNA polymerase sigma factor [Kofleriaceae bacterium]|jgi:RNA polymerase sigma-70 factor (ECF subfamily)|nr:RNA polymerase sigma factor [Kofleriaceae bacterium]